MEETVSVVEGVFEVEEGGFQCREVSRVDEVKKESGVNLERW